MKKFLFYFFTMLIILPSSALTINCKDPTDINCTTDSNINTTDCNDNGKNLDYIYLSSTQIANPNCIKLVKNIINKCSKNLIRKNIGANSDYLIYCDTDNQITIKYDSQVNIEYAKQSYNNRLCIGSGGTPTSNGCSCPQNDYVIQQDNECLCKAANGIVTKYPLKPDRCITSSTIACMNSGGLPDSNNDCTCNPNLNMKQNANKNWCECKNGYRFRDPTRKWEGCVSINEPNINISGTVKDTTSTLPSATISWYDDDGQSIGTTTDNDGHFSATVPNTAYVTFSFTGHQPNTFAATDLTSNQEIVLYSYNMLDEIAIISDPPVELSESSDTTALDLSECENSGGTYNTGDTKCTCTGVLEETVQTYNGKQYSICKCVTGYKRENGNYKDNCIDAGENTTEKVLDTAKMAQNKYDQARKREQSLGNRALTAGTTLTTGLGAMAAASALAEQNADRKAEADMRDYLATFKCEYGNGQQQNAGNEEITLPGGNELLEYYSEYKTLADSVKQTKGALGLRAGIESEILYDRAQTGLYQYSTAARTSTGQISLARALSDETSADAAAWNEQKEKTSKNLTAGLVATTVGIGVGIVGNYLINGRKTELQQKLDTAIEEILPKFEYNPNRENIKIEPMKSELNTENTRVKMPTFDKFSIPTYPVDGEKFDNNRDILKDTSDIDNYISKINLVMAHSPSQNKQTLHFYITGHTDRTGTDIYNKELSLRRANTVKKYLEQKLVVPEYFTIKYSTEGKGFIECPESPTTNPECRRVNIQVVDETEQTQ